MDQQPLKNISQLMQHLLTKYGSSLHRRQQPLFSFKQNAQDRPKTTHQHTSKQANQEGKAKNMNQIRTKELHNDIKKVKFGTGKQSKKQIYQADRIYEENSRLKKQLMNVTKICNEQQALIKYMAGKF